MEEQNKMSENKEAPMNQSAPASETPSSTPSQSNDGAPDSKWLFYILAFLFPLIGVIIGIIYMKKNSEDAKKFGKTTLTISIVVFLLQCLCTVGFFVFGSSLGFVETTYEYGTY